MPRLQRQKQLLPDGKRDLGLSKEMTYKIFFAKEVQETSTDTILTHGGDVENGKCDS